MWSKSFIFIIKKPGINKYGCSFLSANCYFISKCLSADANVDAYSTINCTTNFSTKTVCTKITTTGQ